MTTFPRRNVVPVLEKEGGPPPVTGTVQRAIDVSSNQPRDLSAIIARFTPSHVVVKLGLPWENASARGSTKPQTESACANGCGVLGYGWGYRSADPQATIQAMLDKEREAGIMAPIRWLDCETYTEGGVVKDPGPDLRWLETFEREAERLRAAWGIYSAAWWWDAYMAGMAAFPHVPLWAAGYNRVANLSWGPSFRSFGGWTELAGHQYDAAVIDLDVFDSAYLPTRTRNMPSAVRRRATGPLMMPRRRSAPPGRDVTRFRASSG